VLLVLLPAALAAVPSTAAGPTPARSVSAANTLEAQVLVHLNEVRRRHGLAPLRLSAPLTAAADAHSGAMARFGFFAHDSRDGTAFWKRVRHFYGPGGYSTWSVGENLLWSTGSLDAAAAVELWMKSAGHRRNILTARWREIGLSAVGARSAPGVFGGRDVVIITTDFGVRA
jgi:uncharacterized protein YkwD